MEILTQIIGYIAMVTVFCSFQVKDPRKTLWVMGGAMSLFAIHFALSGAINGAIQNLLGVLRNLCILYTDDRKTSGKIVKGVMLLSFAAAPFAFLLIPSIEVGVLDFVLGIAMAIAAYLFWTALSGAIRMAQLFLISPSWIVYNTLAGSVPGVITECFNLLSVVIFYLRQLIGKSKKTAEERE